MGDVMIMSIIASIFFIVPLALICVTIYLELKRNNNQVDEPDVNVGSLDIDQRYVKDKSNGK